MITTARKRGRPSKSDIAQMKLYDKLTRLPAAARCPTKRVYICSPYKGSTERNAARARIYCRFAYDSGFIPIAPHLYYPQFLDDGDKRERAAGMKYGLQELWQCKELWVFGAVFTDGMRAEIELARDLKIPVKYFDEDMTEA